MPKAEFRKWCDKVGLKAPSLIHTDDTVDGIPGIVVSPTSSLRAGEVAITLPVDAAIVVLADPQSSGKSPIPNVLSDVAWYDAPQKLRLACKLLEERRLGKESHYDGYIEHLPPVKGVGRERIDTLGDWTSDELALLQSPDLVDKTIERSTRDDEWYDNLERKREHEGKNDAGQDKIFTREEFDWAVSVVRTRAFAGDFSVPRNGIEGDYALLPFIDDLNHRETTRRGSDTTESTVSSANAPPFKFPPVSSVLGRTNADICWVAHVAHKGGDEVAHSYLHGAEGLAEDFLHEWGFSPRGADIDANFLSVKGIKVVIRGDGRVEDEGRVIKSIKEEMESSYGGFDGSTGGVTDADVWRCISAKCTSERVRIESNQDEISLAVIRTGADEEDIVSEYRRGIANAFLDGKKRLLRAGSEWALIRADERSRIRAGSIS